ncbi:PAS domain S-box-containing protein [Rhizobium skierniewicense]|uniref:PAS domain S-box-containing protein n=1 Tax=Rhizobium skierniewicense TaxID=984260 RepID=A0A7W6G0X6_9HYPH|nr:LuxR C-terminal-related transcriptional regulator [Rhizobium skierniewicense]MBB3945157.1 PAS domain S-box-containing protein [Rhizobium skierniewicense]
MKDDQDETRVLLSEIPVPMVYATHRIIRDCNEEFAGLFGYERAELVDQSFARLYPKHADFVQTGRMWKAHLPGGKVYYDERIMTTSDGRRFWCQVHGRTRHATDPFAQALYCFQPITRPVVQQRLSLTDRQRQIVTLVSQGKTNAAIAAELGLSPRTIESHRARLMKTAGLKNTAALVAHFTSDSDDA